MSDKSAKRWCPNCGQVQPAAVLVTLTMCQDPDCCTSGQHSHGASHTEVACQVCGLPTQRTQLNERGRR